MRAAHPAEPDAHETQLPSWLAHNKPPSSRPQSTDITATADGPPADSATSSADRPTDALMRANPERASASRMRSLAGPRVAMPTSLHGPHCTLAQRNPPLRRRPHIPSSHPFAKQ